MKETQLHATRSDVDVGETENLEARQSSLVGIRSMCDL